MTLIDAATYVIDADGVVWKVVHDGGMVTRADDTGVTSAGIVWLESVAGPLIPFDPAVYRRGYLEAIPTP